MKRNTVILWLIAPAMLIAVILVVHLQPTVICAFQDGDAIDQAACVTEVRLRDYEEGPDELVEWLLSYHGEATGSQVWYAVAIWTVDEPEKFSDLLSKVHETKADQFIFRVADGVRETGLSERFKEVFSSQASENERLRRIIEKLWK